MMTTAMGISAVRGSRKANHEFARIDTNGHE